MLVAVVKSRIRSGLGAVLRSADRVDGIHHRTVCTTVLIGAGVGCSQEAEEEAAIDDSYCTEYNRAGSYIII